MVRFVVAMLKHETNTFSPIPTMAEAFGADGPLFGADALKAMRGTRTPMATMRRFLLFKSRMHFRAAFAPIAGAIVECDGVGVTSSDLSLFSFARLARPVYPLDEIADWSPGMSA